MPKQEKQAVCVCVALTGLDHYTAASVTAKLVCRIQTSLVSNRVTKQKCLLMLRRSYSTACSASLAARDKAAHQAAKQTTKQTTMQSHSQLGVGMTTCSLPASPKQKGSQNNSQPVPLPAEHRQLHSLQPRHKQREVNKTKGRKSSTVPRHRLCSSS